MATQDEIDRGDVIEDETAEETEEETTEEEGTEEAGAEEPAAESEAGDEAAVEETEEPEEAVLEAASQEEHMLPKSRYDSVQKRNRALQEKISRMEEEREQMIAARKEVAPTEALEDNRLSELDDQINDALLDGDKDKAKTLRAEQRTIEHEFFKTEMAEATGSATEVAREQVRLDASVDFLESTYDELNPRADTFDQKRVDEMESLRHAFVASGDYSPSQALLKAAKYVFPDAAPLQEAPVPAASKKEAVKAAVKAGKKQPPDIGGVGEDSDTAGVKDDIDPGRLSEKDFDALPEATLKRLRGDLM